MLIPTLGLLIHWLFKTWHLEGAAIINLVMIPVIIVGFFVVFGRRQIEETKPFQLIMIFLIIDLIGFLFG